MHFQPSLVYINGEYWGLYNLRERIDEYYIASLFKLKRDSIHIIDGRYKVKKGSLDEWNPLWKIVESDTMMHDTTYAKVRELLDIESFIDYNIAEIFFSNFDWPGNNMVSWKPTNKGKWRYLFYDLDATLQNYKRDNMKHATLAGVNKFPFNDKASLFFRSLLRNKKFSTQFYKRYINLLENEFSYSSTKKVLNKIIAIYKPFIENQSNRWHKPDSIEEWEKAIEDIHIFLKERPAYVIKHLDSYIKGN